MSASTLGMMTSNHVFSSDSVADSSNGLPLGFSTYGLPGQSLEEAIDAIAKAGYDAVEICVTTDRDACAERMKPKRRQEVLRRIQSLGMRITSLMSHLQPLGTIERHRSDLERLKRDCDLANELSPDAPPVIQTVLGGKHWPEEKYRSLERLAAWTEIANQHRAVIAVKPHRGHAMSRPTEASWLISQLGNPSCLRMWFDYSHFVLRDMKMEQAVNDSLPIIAGVAVKDAKKFGDKVRFVLPGEAGSIDYARLLTLLYAGGYRDSICVEVSSQVWKQPNYDANLALNQSYITLVNAFQKAQIGLPQKDNP